MGFLAMSLDLLEIVGFTAISELQHAKYAATLAFLGKLWTPFLTDGWPNKNLVMTMS